MDKDELIAILQQLPTGTKVLVRGGAATKDDAWNPTVRTFNTQSGWKAIVEADCENREHYNYPAEKYCVKEIPPANPMLNTESCKKAARVWIERYHTKAISTQQEKALAVLLFSLKTSDWLAQNDPKALEQAQTVLTGYSFVDFLE